VTKSARWVGPKKKSEEANMNHSTNIWSVIAKRIALTSVLALTLMLTALVVAAASGYAQPQGSVTATGVLVGPVEDGDQDPTPKYRLADEETGTNYVLISGFVELDPYAGQRVTIAGEPIGGADWAPPALNVTQIQPADGGGGNDPPVNDKATLSYELTVDGDPPASAAFYGHVHTGEGGPGQYVPLTDPDEDRLYTGSTIVDRFGPGPRPVPPSVEPVSLPVRIVQESGGNIEVIKDFGTVKLDGDKTFSASVSFPVDDCPIISPTPELCNGSGGSDNEGSSGGSGPNSGGSSDAGSGSSSGSSDGDSSGDNNSGAGEGGSGSAGSSSGGVSADIADGLRGVLPSTGGDAALWVLGAGVVLVAGGLLVRKAFQ
jgi:LPXTG-motif cell wall-anchored protein